MPSAPQWVRLIGLKCSGREASVLVLPERDYRGLKAGDDHEEKRKCGTNPKKNPVHSYHYVERQRDSEMLTAVRF